MWMLQLLQCEPAQVAQRQLAAAIELRAHDDLVGAAVRSVTARERRKASRALNKQSVLILHRSPHLFIFFTSISVRHCGHVAEKLHRYDVKH